MENLEKLIKDFSDAHHKLSEFMKNKLYSGEDKGNGMTQVFFSKDDSEYIDKLKNHLDKIIKKIRL